MRATGASPKPIALRRSAPARDRRNNASRLPLRRSRPRPRRGQNPPPSPARRACRTTGSSRSNRTMPRRRPREQRCRLPEVPPSNIMPRTRRRAALATPSSPTLLSAARARTGCPAPPSVPVSERRATTSVRNSKPSSATLLSSARGAANRAVFGWPRSADTAATRAAESGTSDFQTSEIPAAASHAPA